jgi:long-chain acyl-CoA synthetase
MTQSSGRKRARLGADDQRAGEPDRPRALGTFSPETLTQWKADNGKPETATIAELRDDPALRAEIRVAVNEANKSVSQVEAIKKFIILDDDFTEAGAQLTPTQKVRRGIVVEQYAAQIASLYDDGGS